MANSGHCPEKVVGKIMQKVPMKCIKGEKKENKQMAFTSPSTGIIQG
jgi:hypothetical protein